MYSRLFRAGRPAGLAWLLLVYVSMLGCQGDAPHLPVEPTPDALSVNFLLQHGGPAPEFDDPEGQRKTPPERVYGFIGRVSDPNEQPLRYVHDAAASINGVALRVRQRGWFDGTSRPLESEYNYYTDSLAVEPGGEYTLVVEQSGQRLVSTTRVPGEFRLTGIAGEWSEATTPRGQPLVLTWTRAAGASLYAVSVRSAPDPSLLEVTSPSPFLTADTTAVLQLASSHTGPIPVLVEIRAMDPNLYRTSAYQDGRAGIEGGYGFFGSAHVKRYDATLRVPR